MYASDIGRYLSDLLQSELLEENLKYTAMLEDGLQLGNDSIIVSGILVCWMATIESIKAAISNNCNLIICHEDLFFKSVGNDKEKYEKWFANNKRRQLLRDNNIVVYRIHSPLDVLYNTDAALEAMNLPIKDVYSEWIARVARIEKMSIGSIIQKAFSGFDVKNIRFVGDLDRIVENVGIAVGGMGLSFNGFFQEWLRNSGAEVIITGEFDDYEAFWAIESDVAMIAVSHPSCENLGLKKFTNKLNEEFPELNINFYECHLPVKNIMKSSFVQ